MNKTAIRRHLREIARGNGARLGDPLARKNQVGSRFQTDAYGRVWLTPINSPREIKVRLKTRPQTSRGQKISVAEDLAKLLKEIDNMERLMKEMLNGTI